MLLNRHNCSICGNKSLIFLKKTVLKKYTVKYYKCINCGFIETEKPRYWLKEAYNSAIIDADTGIIGRNILLSRITAVLGLLFLNKNSKILDVAGGYGLMTRMLRDIGLDAYWDDKYAENIFSKKFVGDKNNHYDIVTAFEYLEHMNDPCTDVRNIMSRYNPKAFIFSTTLHNGNPPNNWWYYVENGGQHISLYTSKSLELLATKIGVKYSTNGVNIHVFSRIKIPTFVLMLISVTSSIYSLFMPIFYKSKTFSDHLNA